MHIKLKIIDQPDVLRTGCGTEEHCSKCELHGVVCPGNRGHCTHKQSCTQRECYGDCENCGGGLLNPGAAVAICCKSPLRDSFINSVREDREIGAETYKYTKRDKIVLRTKGVIVTQGGVGSAFGDKSPFPKEVEAVAVNLRHVWSSRGWYSRDFRDYMRLEKHQKLILLTALYDDVLERAWDAKLYDEDFASLGFDWWETLRFSQYASGSNTAVYFHALRNMWCMSAGASWFADVIDASGLKKEWIEARMREQTAKVPQVMHNMQGLGAKQEDMKEALRHFPFYHRILPENVTMWVNGPIRPVFLKAIRSLMPGRDVYLMSAAPWISGQKGKLLQDDGKLVYTKLPKNEVIWENQRAFLRITQRA